MPIAPSQPETKAQNAPHPISETRSEVERNAFEISKPRRCGETDPQPSPQLDHPHGDQQTRELRMPLFKVKALRDIPEFVALDGTTYSLKQGEEALIPKTSARELYRRRMAILM